MDVEREIVQLMVGAERTTPNMTDKYKIHMAKIGVPFRPETFYLSFRRGGPYFNPFDLKRIVEYLYNEEMKPFVRCIPENCWFTDREPIVSLRGDSQRVSWVEPLLTMVRFPIQVATAIKNGATTFAASCPDEARIIHLVGEKMRVGVVVANRSVEYIERLNERLYVLSSIDATRIFEVGFRAATCMQQHEIVLENCAKFGIFKTSNVHLANNPRNAVGTIGHEHQQRFCDDLSAFRVAVERDSGTTSLLFDTYDIYNKGIPAIRRIFAEYPGRIFVPRFDSGDHKSQLRTIDSLANACGVKTRYIFEDGYNPDKIFDIENYIREIGIDPSRVSYGVGSYLVNGNDPHNQLTRSAASAVYKLCVTGLRPTMKFSGNPGKSSIPGETTILRSANGTDLIALVDEDYPDGFVPLDLANPELIPINVKLSVGVVQLIDQLSPSSGELGVEDGSH